MSPIKTISRAPRAVRSHPLGGILGLFGALVALDVWKKGSLPDLHGFLVYAALAGLVVVSASVAPDLVTWTLAVLILYWALMNEPAVTDLISRFVKQIGA